MHDSLLDNIINIANTKTEAIIEDEEDNYKEQVEIDNDIENVVLTNESEDTIASDCKANTYKPAKNQGRHAYE